MDPSTAFVLLVCPSQTPYKDHPSVILGSVGVLSFLVERCNLNLRGSVVPSGDQAECLRFSSVVHHARIFGTLLNPFRMQI